jgi:hypothetical protein
VKWTPQPFIFWWRATFSGGFSYRPLAPLPVALERDTITDISTVQREYENEFFLSKFGKNILGFLLSAVFCRMSILSIILSP